MNTANDDLPSATSQNLELCEQSEEEKLVLWRLNGQAWSGPLSMEAYIRREQHLGKQALTRDGGITYWVLTESSKPPNKRPLLASCESLKKRALVKRYDGEVEDIVSHGIGSVFCDPKYRGRGYARRMIEELGRKLDGWKQTQGRKTLFTVLYSDIGKKFYTQSGWRPFPSSHIALPALEDNGDPEDTGMRQLYADDLVNLCEEDEQMLREALENSESESQEVKVAFIPDIATISWLHAREEFVSSELLGRIPKVKGAYVRCSNGKRVWCIWARFFADQPTKGNVLYILRMVIEGEHAEPVALSEPTANGKVSSCVSEEQVQAVASLLRAAQIQAALWQMNDIEIWNPGSAVTTAAKILDPSSGITHRDEDSIASLRWHSGDVSEKAKVTWIGNEKYGWC